MSDVRAVHCTDGTCLNSPTDYTSCQELPGPQLNKDPGSIPGWGRFSGEGNGNLLQYSCLEKSHGRSLIGYSPWGRKESDMTEQLDLTDFTSFL